jgi:pyruvate dehydrogenase E2 component (dihydrolipoamide acetyltransferase)
LNFELLSEDDLPSNVIMPALGVAQQTGKLLKWLKTEGQAISKGEPLMEIETDKATVEIEAPASGVLAQVSAQAGDEVPVGNRIAVILAPGETASAAAQGSSHPSSLRKGGGTEGGRAATSSPVAALRPPLPLGEGRGEGRAMTSTPARAARTGRILASPAARRIAAEKGIDLAALKGSGPEGSILAQDVLQVATAASPQRTGVPVAAEIVPLTSMRRIVGERMTLSKQSAPHFYLSTDIDMNAVERLRVDLKMRGEPQAVPSINDFILFACARALKEFPSLNSTYTEEGIKPHHEVNLGMAVALDEGLVVPVICNADRLSLSELAEQSRTLVDKAQRKKLFPLDYEGGTFTVSNLGMLGVDNFIAIINPPQSAILAVGRVAPRVVAESGMFAIKSIMTATLSADHRVIDGAIGARFLQGIKRRLEHPEA